MRNPLRRRREGAATLPSLTVEILDVEALRRIGPGLVGTSRDPYPDPPCGDCGPVVYAVGGWAIFQDGCVADWRSRDRCIGLTTQVGDAARSRVTTREWNAITANGKGILYAARDLSVAVALATDAAEVDTMAGNQ